MMTSKRALQTALKMTAVYAFAMTTAVACGKFEGSTTIKKGSANGTSAVTTNVPVPTGDMSIDIENVSRQFQGGDEFGQLYWNVKVGINHSGRKIAFSIFPQVEPYVQDSGKSNVGSVQYDVESICGNADCTKFGVLVNATDTSNAQNFQRFEYWDLATNATAPVNRLTQTAFASVTEGYETMSNSKLNQ